MFKDLEESYKKAAKDIKAEFIIPSGMLMQKLLKNNIQTVHRDTFHLSRGLARYAVGLLWYALLSKNNIDENTFCDFDEPVTDEEILIIKKCINEIIYK